MKHISNGRPPRFSPFFYRCIPENAVFWMVLVLLSIGCITSLYEKSAKRTDETTGVFAVSHDGTAEKETHHNYKFKDRYLPIYCVQTEKPQVALSFDAAWGNEDTKQIMDILEKYNVKVTFFMTGGWVEQYPEDVKYISAQAHDLGNHSENHKNMSQLDEKEMRSELKTTHDKVKNLTGINMNLFRPPYGDYNNDVISTADSMNYYPVQWDIDSVDWKDYGTASIVDKVLNNKHLGNGSIILLHNGAKYTPAALETIITGLQKKGYELVPISELIIQNNFHMDSEGRQIPD